jgi:hypothetical protein
MMEDVTFAAINVACFVGMGLLCRMIAPLFDRWFQRKTGRRTP